MTVLWHDFETKSRADIKKSGGPYYSRHPSTRVLMCAYAFDNDEKVQQWVPAEGQKMPRDLRDAIRDPDVLKSAFNAAFEMGIWQNVLDEEIFFEEWRCTQVAAMTLSFPAALEKVGPIVNLPTDKQKDSRGKALIRKFCIPRKPTKNAPWEWNTMHTHEEEWEEFKEYNIQDVIAERAIWGRIKKWQPPEHEWAMWHIDREINEDGIPINRRVMERAIEFTQYIRDKQYQRIRKLTGVENPRSNPQMLEWLRDHGYRFNDLKAGHVKRAAEDERLSEKTREVLTLRSEVAKTSTDKYKAMARSIDPDDDVIRGCFKFAGAQRTWRWSGQIIQPQNLARPHPAFEECQPQLVEHLETLSNEALVLLYDKHWKSKGPTITDMLSTAIRPTIQAPKGEMIFAADLNAIENRVLGYLAQDQKILDVFRNNRDPYIDFAKYMFNTTYEIEYERYKPKDGSKGNKDHRTIAKPGVLGCGYMLSAGEEWENEDTGEIEATGLLGYAWNMGVSNFTMDDSELSVKVWRATFEKAVEYWWEIDKAAKKCLRTGKPTQAGPVEFDRSGPFMRMWLPSGRALHYCRPRLEQTVQYFCEEKRKYLPWHLCKRPVKEDTRVKENITYEGLNDKNHWGRIHTHPGKWTENADQAISRDILAQAIKRFRRRVPRSEGRIRLHVHDEPVGIGPEKYAERNLKILIECMTEPMPWASEKELPLGAAGSISKVWIKD